MHTVGRTHLPALQNDILYYRVQQETPEMLTTLGQKGSTRQRMGQTDGRTDGPQQCLMPYIAGLDMILSCYA